MFAELTVMESGVVNLPNALTLLRLALAPVIAWALLQRLDMLALVLFSVSAATELADGMLARRWNQRTQFGAVADPAADKTTALLVLLVLVAQDDLPLWFVAAAVLRDLLIVGGALAFRAIAGRMEMGPSAISKVNTGLLFALVLGVLSVRARVVPAGDWLDVLQWTALVTIIVSGAHYVWVWGRKARRLREPE